MDGPIRRGAEVRLRGEPTDLGETEFPIADHDLETADSEQGLRLARRHPRRMLPYRNAPPPLLQKTNERRSHPRSCCVVSEPEADPQRCAMSGTTTSCHARVARNQFPSRPRYIDAELSGYH